MPEANATETSTQRRCAYASMNMPRSLSPNVMHMHVDLREAGRLGISPRKARPQVSPSMTTPQARTQGTSSQRRCRGRSASPTFRKQLFSRSGWPLQPEKEEEGRRARCDEKLRQTQEKSREEMWAEQEWLAARCMQEAQRRRQEAQRRIEQAEECRRRDEQCMRRGECRRRSEEEGRQSMEAQHQESLTDLPTWRREQMDARATDALPTQQSSWETWTAGVKQMPHVKALCSMLNEVLLGSTIVPLPAVAVPALFHNCAMSAHPEVAALRRYVAAATQGAAIPSQRD